MNLKALPILVTTITLSLSFVAQAHDPKEHMKNAEKPDCAAMENMGHGDMDMNDPVMQAMMQKCMDNKDKNKASEHSSKASQDNITGHSAKHNHH